MKWRWQRGTLLTAAIALLAAQGLSAPQAAPKPTLDQVAAVLRLPESVWTNINRFVFLVAFDVYATGQAQLPYQHHLSKLDSYKELQAACREWGRTTFPLLQKIAADLAKDDIGKMLAAMKGASEGIQAIAEGRGHSGQLGEFHKTFDTQSKALEARLQGLGSNSDIATAQMDRLMRASKATIFEYKARKLPPTEFVEVGADPNAVLLALTAANGSWKWLLADVKELRRLVEKAQFADTRALYAQIGLDTWRDISGAARGFITNVPHQQRFLSGDNYYDNCGAVEGRWYAVLNMVERDENGRMVRGGLRKGFFGTGESTGLVLSSALIPGGKAPAGSDPTENLHLDHSMKGVGNSGWDSWRFGKLGQGWWRITNAAAGTSKAMDTGKMAPLGDFSGQLWRFLPAGKWGGCRLINSYLGDLSSLTAERRAGAGDAVYDVGMSVTTNAPKQQWLLRDVTI